MTYRPDTFDVVVVGAGPAGSATARRLALAGCHVALIEHTRFDAARIGESLAPNVQPLLRELGVWEPFLTLKPLPSLGTRSVWGEDAEVRAHSHLMSPWGCGWHVDRLAFDRMLAEAAHAVGADLRCGTTVLRCDRSADGWELRFRVLIDGGSCISQLRAKVVIDATGRAARLAPWLAAHRLLFDHLIGIAAQFTGIDNVSQGHVMVETTDDGWWYSAPVPNRGMMTMLMTDSDLCRRANLVSRPTWDGRLQTAASTRTRVARGRLSWGPKAVSAISQRLRRSERRQPWLAVGDAALAVDPVTGSGVVRALRSAKAASKTALALLEGRTEAIEQYETERDGECTNYLHERLLYYGAEQRWPKSDFWGRRTAVAERVNLPR